MPACVGRGSTNQIRTVEVPIATAKALTDYTAAAITTGTLTLPSDEAWSVDEATTRAAFVAKMVGVNGQLKQANVARIPGNSQDNIVVVESEGEYDVVVESSTFEIGEYIGPSKAAGNALLDTTFKKVTPLAGAVFIVIRRYASATTLVRAKLISGLVRASR